MPCVGGKFKPAPNEVLTLGQQRYTVRRHPSAPMSPHSAEGRRATVYHLDGPGNKSFALKVFRKKYVDASLAGSAQVMARFQNLPGMLAAQRIVLGPGEQAVVNCPELLYSSLMPWIGGVTWNDILFQAEKGLPAYDPDLALRLCRRFLEVMSALQREQAAHSDIAPGNVVAGVQRSGDRFMSSGAPDIQLVDLEDIYASGVIAPKNQNTGTPNYRHPSADESGTSTWCLEGDRYATAVMAAEMLLLGSTTPVKQSFEYGVFSGNREKPEAAKQVSVCLPYLRSLSDSFAGCFETAWTSPTLSACPQASDLLAALPRPQGTVNFTLPGRPSGSSPVSTPAIPGVQWAPIPQPGFRGAAPAPTFTPLVPTPPTHFPSGPSPAPLSPDAAKFWSNAPVNQTTTPATSLWPAATNKYSSAQPSSRAGKIALIIFAIIVVLSAIIYGVVRMNQAQSQQLEMERERQAELLRQNQESLTKAFTDYELWMRIKASELSQRVSRLSVIDTCKHKSAYIAVRFQSPVDSDHWVTMGWWKIEANSYYVLPVVTTTDKIYIYADAVNDTSSWSGKTDSDHYLSPVINDHSQKFLLKDGDNTSLAYHEVRMAPISMPYWGKHNLSLTCKD